MAVGLVGLEDWHLLPAAMIANTKDNPVAMQRPLIASIHRPRLPAAHAALETLDLCDGGAVLRLPAQLLAAAQGGRATAVNGIVWPCPSLAQC